MRFTGESGGAQTRSLLKQFRSLAFAKIEGERGVLAEANGGDTWQEVLARTGSPRCRFGLCLCIGLLRKEERRG